MTPFQGFRLWLRRAPLGERLVAAVAGTVVIALLTWTIGEVAGGGQSVDRITSANGPVEETSPLVTTGSTAGSGALPSAGRVQRPLGQSPRPVGPAAVPPLSSGSPGQLSTVSGCTTPRANAPGVTATQIKVAVSVLDLAGPASNSVFGIPDADTGIQWYTAIISAINASGGVACRQLVPTYYKVNGADASSRQAKCVEIAAGGFFADIDGGGFGNFPEKHCLAQHHMPFFGNSYLFADEAKAYYPYLFAFNSFDVVYRNAVFALRDHGFFTPSNGFKKLGFIYRDCHHQAVTNMQTALHQAGLTSSQIVGYSVGCPSAFANPSDLQQAVLKFKANDVTHVTTVDFLGDMASFTKIAQQQGFRPKYGLGDDDIIQISYGNLRPDPKNIDGAIAITPNTNGEERTPGMRPSAATRRCDAILVKAHIAPSYQSSAGSFCDQLWMFKAAVEHAPVIEPGALAAGLQRAKSVDFAFPGGPNDFSRAGTVTGGQYWRVAQFFASCECWRVTVRVFHPSYA